MLFEGRFIPMLGEHLKRSSILISISGTLFKKKDFAFRAVERAFFFCRTSLLRVTKGGEFDVV